MLLLPLFRHFRLKKRDVLGGGIVDYGNMSNQSRTLCLIWEVDVKETLKQVYHCFEKPVLEKFRQIDPLIQKIESYWNSHQITMEFPEIPKVEE